MSKSSTTTEMTSTNVVSEINGMETNTSPVIRFENVRLDSMLSVVAKEYHRVLYFRDGRVNDEQAFLSHNTRATSFPIPACA